MIACLLIVLFVCCWTDGDWNLYVYTLMYCALIEIGKYIGF